VTYFQIIIALPEIEIIVIKIDLMFPTAYVYEHLPTKDSTYKKFSKGCRDYFCNFEDYLINEIESQFHFGNS